MPKIKNVSKLSPLTVIQCDACFTNMYYRDALEHCVDEHQKWLKLMKLEDIISKFFFLVPLNQTLDLDNNPDYELGAGYRAALTRQQILAQVQVPLQVPAALVQSQVLAQAPSRDDLYTWNSDMTLLC
ncbi:hypothetical protein CJU90_5631 [Yarrowia sp. C11]|nr:hypothetical protein CJU90_5631 [Yarrowia sp. C11]KAG5364215.1 hypothetical protein CKK34_3008 [Yarrowia sp. E02]